MKKNIFIKIILLFIVIALLGGGTFYISKWYSKNKLEKENEEMLALLDSELLKDDYYRALQAEEEIKNGTEILLPYVQAAFYWKSIGDMSSEEVFYNRAIKIYKDAIEKFGMQYYMPYSNLAGIYQATGEYKKAEDMLKTAIEVTPGEGSLYLKLADLYRYDLEKSEEEVLAVYDEALTRVLSTLELVINKATYLRDIDRKEESLEIFELVYKANPDSIYVIEINQLRKDLGMGPLNN